MEDYLYLNAGVNILVLPHWARALIEARVSYVDPGPRKASAHMHYANNNHNQPIGAFEYELSQQLIDKRTSCLERKYGGRSARQAAITIQRAWRSHRLQRRFATIAIQAYNKQHANCCATGDRNIITGKRRQINIHQHYRKAKPSLQSSSSSQQLTVVNNQNFNNNCNNNSTPVNKCYRVENLPSSKRLSATSASSDDSSMSMSSGSSGHPTPQQQVPTAVVNTAQFECLRKRQYRVGLNLFNKNPDRGINYLVAKGFIEAKPSNNEQSLASIIGRFLLTRKGLSKQMIGEFISGPQPFNQCVLRFFAQEIDLRDLPVDSALRKFQTYFRFPGEAQKIERLVEAFAYRYVQCNETSSGLELSRDDVFILSFAIIMLNTDLHVPTNAKSRMTPQQWLNNLRGVFSGRDLNQDFLLEIYERVKSNELRTGADHLTQVLKVQQSIVGKEVPNLCQPHRRLVCYCRLYEVRDLAKKEKAGQHQREIFLFNDLFLVTKLTGKSRNGRKTEYQYRQSFSLEGLQVTLFSSAHHRFGIRLTRRVDDRVIATFNARNELDRSRFVDDLKESIAEMDEMEHLRITKASSLIHLNHLGADKIKSNPSEIMLADQRSSISSSQSTIYNQSSSNNSMVSATVVYTNIRQARRCSSGSLDSGLSLSRDNSPNQQSNNSVNSAVVEAK